MKKTNVGADALKLARKERGITLIALIITIIVMLILVAVSIRIAIQTGLFDSAGKATQKWDTAQDAEAELGNGKVNVGGTVYNSIDEYVAGRGNGGGATVIAGGRATKNSTYTDSEGKTAIIPAGFTVSGVKNGTTDETTIDDGLVIYLIPEGTTVDWTDGEEIAEAQKTYDQFVWIPIKNTTDANSQDINDMYICQGKTSSNGVCTITVENGVAKCANEKHSSIEEGTEINKNTLMAGRLYAIYAVAVGAFSGFETKITETYTSGSGLREPDVGTEDDGKSTYLRYLSSILEPDVEADKKEYTSIESFKEKLQEEYNEVVKSVYENQGFYVGRYETSGMAQSVTNYDVAIVAGARPSVRTDWYHMYAQQKNYAKANNLTVGSTMIQGAAYDQVMKFVDTEDYDVKTVGNVGHSTEQGAGSIYQTGGLNYNAKTDEMTDYKEYKDVSKNIYDLEGNVKVWTTEVCGNNFPRVIRGGFCVYPGDDPASYRFNNVSSEVSFNDELGSLVKLYVK